MRILILILLLSKIIFAQYDSTMYDLIKTTYERSFDKEIINQYLYSNSDNKVKAALLSLSQSEDTTYVPEILNLDFNKYGKNICFALGEIGRCEQSIKFLGKQLLNSPAPKFLNSIFFAIGKIGNENDLLKLIDFYNSFKPDEFTFNGISEAILQFNIRGIKNQSPKSILENEIINYSADTLRLQKALFTLARYGGSEKVIPVLKNILLDKSFSEKTKQFAILNLVSLKMFPDFLADNNITTKQISDNLRIHLSKFLCYKEIKNETDLDILFKYLRDRNENVSLQSAVSLKELILPLDLQEVLKERIDTLLFDNSKSMSFKGELFLSRFKLLGNYDDHKRIANKINLPLEFKIKFLINDPNSIAALDSISEIYLSDIRLNIKIEALTQLIELQSKLSNNEKLNSIFLNAISSDKAPLISISSDGVDSLFVIKHRDELLRIIQNQIDNYQDDPDFIEATMSLINLAEKVDDDFFNTLLEKSSQSDIYSLRRFTSTKTGNKIDRNKELNMFEQIWKYAFNYRQALMKTLKGDIKIEFNSELAPVSVANFCLLAKRNFYNNIKFHRVVPGFVIQAGDPTATGWGGPGYDIISEFSNSKFDAGYVGMASAGKDTEGSQIFIMQGNYPHLNGRYTLFAKVIDGMDVVYNITQDDYIMSVEFY